MSDRFARRGALGALLTTAALGTSRPSWAFGFAGAFSVRMLDAGGVTVDAARVQASSRWAWELMRRTSAPARLSARRVRADEPKLLSEPFCVWAGARAVRALSKPELQGLRRFFALGGVMVVDDADPRKGTFGKSVRREFVKILPRAALVKLSPKHVLYKSYYLLDRPAGRHAGPRHVEAIVRGSSAQVLFLKHDLLGALARKGGSWALEVLPGSASQREQAIRLAVNLAMYVLCSNYKDDQVHAKSIMRRVRRAR